MSVRDGQPPGEWVVGECPMGCGRTLFLGTGGYVTCSWHACPNPTAASDRLTAPAVSAPESGRAGADELHRLRQRLAGWHFGQESLSPGEREILHVGETVLRLLDALLADLAASEKVAAPESGRAHTDGETSYLATVQMARDEIAKADRLMGSEPWAVRALLEALDACEAERAASEQARDENVLLKAALTEPCAECGHIDWRSDGYLDPFIDARDRAVEALREAHEFIQRARPLLGMSVKGSLGAQADAILDALTAVGGAHQPGGEQT